jgi:hypothetical protein
MGCTPFGSTGQHVSTMGHAGARGCSLKRWDGGSSERSWTTPLCICHIRGGIKCLDSTSDVKPKIEHCDSESESCAKDVKPKIEHCDSESESCAKDVKPKIEHCDSESESCAKDL